MPYTILTLADCKQSLADRMTNGILPTDSATLTYWTRLLNRGVNYCADRLRISKQTTLTTANGTIALPDDFLTIKTVHSSGNVEQIQVGQTDIAEHTGPVFWISGDQANGFYLNTPSDETWTVDYAYRPSPMSSDSDECVIPDIEAPVSYAYSKKRQSESDPFEDADKAMQECDIRIKEMASAKSVNNDELSFTLL